MADAPHHHIKCSAAPEGATIDEIAATGWQPHTVRGATAGALKKKLGLGVAIYARIDDWRAGRR